MASSTLSPYKNNTTTQVFTLVTTGTTATSYKVAGRDLSCPYSVEIQRKLAPANASTNDHVVLRLARTERNVETSKLATLQVLVDISIPKDTSVLTATTQKEILSVVASLLNESSVMSATTVAVTALIEGRDL